MKTDHWTAYQRCLKRIEALSTTDEPDPEELEQLRREITRLAELLEEDLFFVETRRAPAPLQAPLDDPDDQ